MDRNFLYAKPSATDVKPYNFYTYPFFDSNQNDFVLYGKSFLAVRNLYLSASDIKVFNNLTVTFYNPFSGIPSLKDSNPGFVATVVPNFLLINNSRIVFNIPDKVFTNVINQPPPYGVYIDVIVENEAGYALLSRDSYNYSISSWSGFVNYQKPCINGIFISNPLIPT